VVVFVAVLLKAEMTRRRWAFYRQQAAFHTVEQRKSERIELVIKKEIALLDRINAGFAGRWPDCGTMRREEDAARRLLRVYTTRTAYHARLAQEFLRQW
jgi:hypothetical protein